MRAALGARRFDALVCAARAEPAPEMLDAARALAHAHRTHGVAVAVLLRQSLDMAAQWVHALGDAQVIQRPARRQTLLDAIARPPTSARAAPPAATPAPAAGTAAAADNRALEVLLVEDNPVNQLLAREFLRVLGASTTLAETGVAALDAIKARAFDLVLMDWQLPEMDGLEATRRVRALEAASGGRRVPIVAVTANAMQGDREKCLAAGADEYLTKPFRVEHLRAVMNRVLGSTH